MPLLAATALALTSGVIVFTPLPRRIVGVRQRHTATQHPEAPAQHGPVHAAFPLDEYLAELHAVRTKVCILDTFPLPYAPAPEARRTYLHGLRAALEAGAEVQILLLHARSAVLSDRVESALRDVVSAESYRAQIYRAMADLDALRAALPEPCRSALQVRLTNTFPAVTCYQLDDRVLTAFYPPDRLASEAPHAWVDGDSPIGDFARDRFANLWEHAEELDLHRHLFCEIQLDTDPDGARRRIPRTRFVERGSRLYVCFDSRDVRDQAFDERYLYALLPEPSSNWPEYPVRYTVERVKRSMAASIGRDFSAKYPDATSPWRGIGELQAA